MVLSSSTVVPYSQDASIEIQFAKALQSFQLGALDPDPDAAPSPFNFISNFKQIAASQALQLSTEMIQDEHNDVLKDSFESWDLETKLWHLVEQLYFFRISNSQEEPISLLDNSNSISSLKELLIIINWLQTNSKLEDYVDDVLDVQQTSKWSNTKIAIGQSELKALISKTNPNLVENLDVDAPLRTNGQIDSKDQEVDTTNFRIIYKLLLTGKLQEAIDFSNNTGNFALALILVGASQEHINPLLDGIENIEDSSRGIKHKHLWRETVFKLSQQSGLNYYEKLIYNYLSGGNISENLKFSEDSWEESLLLYCTQLLSYKLDTLVKSSEATLSILLPHPQSTNMKDILNVLAEAKGTKVSQASRHPLRIITGSVMINEVGKLMSTTLNAQTDENVVRILVHLSIFLAILNPSNIPQNMTKILTLYITKLSDDKRSELIPIYLSFIPNEQEAREVYSIILSSITSREERLKLLDISKKLNQQLIIEDDMAVIDNSNNDKLVNVLRRTVERVMDETESYYQPTKAINLQDDLNESIDETDYKLSRAVDWFFENQMHQDSIKASIILIRRFLIMGKLTSLRIFMSDKNFNQIISEYNLQSLNEESNNDEISEDMKSELLDYSLFSEGLKLIHDWKEFTLNGNSYNNPSVEKSLRKTEKTMKTLIFKWLIDLAKSSSDPIFQEFRSLYIPYLLIELMTIYQNARTQSWIYIEKAFDLINAVADDESYDLISCLKSSGRLNEFLVRFSELSITASERGLSGIFK